MKKIFLKSNTNFRIGRRALRICMLFIPLTALIFLTACPYESRAPIDKPKININIKLLGKWKKSKYSKDYLVVKKKNAREYTIVRYKYNSSKKNFKTTKFSAHLSRVGGKTFVNVKSPRSNYYLYRLDSASSSRVQLSEVTRNIQEKFSSSSQLKSFIKKHMGLSFFFNRSRVKYIRK